MFIEGLFQNPAGWLCTCGIIVFSICCHEYMHARVALWEGDSTAADAGHLTLNPLKQMGWGSLGMLALIGLAWGGVPVNPSRFRHSWGAEAVALAGPMTNLLLWLICIQLTNLGLASHVPMFFCNALLQAAVINLLLALLNLCPIPGLDGATVFQRILPARMKTGNLNLLLILLLLVGGSYLFRAAEWLTFLLVRLPSHAFLSVQ